MFSLSEVKYRNDAKLPFNLLDAIPGFFCDILRLVKFGQISKQFNITELELTFASFAHFNSSLVKNALVYLFWLVAARWLNEAIKFTPEMIKQLRKALAEQVALITVNFLVKLRREYMDALIEMLPYVYALTIRQIFNSKIKDHDLNLNLSKDNFI